MVLIESELLFINWYHYLAANNWVNSWMSISPSLLVSASRIIWSTSASDNFSPMDVNTCLNSAAEILPSPLRSKTLNASAISASESVSFIFSAIMVKNSGKSIRPSSLMSTSLIMSVNSLSEGFWPKDLMTVPNSLVVIFPSSSLSNKEKASLNSAICSSDNFSDLLLVRNMVGGERGTC